MLCSTATRARQTLEPLLSVLGDPEVSYEEGLYHAWADSLAERIAALDPALDRVLLVGHNPGLQELALLLSSPSPTRDRIAAKLPTGALVRLELDGSWQSIETQPAELTALVVPRELA